MIKTVDSSQRERFEFIDIARGIAVLWMIQVHITNEILKLGLQKDWFFQYLNVSNGYVAPTFIFCAGAGLWIALSRKGLEYAKGEQSFWVYLRRLAYILFWAYMLHVPFYSVERMVQGNLAELTPWLQMDVLHVIVYSSLVAVGVFMAIARLNNKQRLPHTLRIFNRVNVVIVVCLVCFVWTAVGVDTTSPFPFFPWCVYLFAGLVFGAWFFDHPNRRIAARYCVIAGLVVPVIAFATKELPMAMPYDATWWVASPGLLCFRISATLLLLGILFYAEQRLMLWKATALLAVAGKESLFMYISHLLIVYNYAFPLFLRSHDVFTSGYGGIVVVWFVITVPLLALMLVWHTMKKRRPQVTQQILAVQVLLIISLLFILPSNFSLAQFWQIF
jgi:uncharacterized membrane protein